ncbi:hypothetical protein [Micromonospora craniellae]|uniref:Uncharacterized protein n=1 Tax=Micromonospora craniellae TaxID=2294034 RepID=A0A372G5W2_9ACTN|nr:hypothetical protein [Micromonospora craniellae]QOC90304.1 hypothetical protein ID554_19185 [Micromonospora craniellae]RFS48304.1 hypothetical protein D0Q02_02150 [Micromonospora craniellae]
MYRYDSDEDAYPQYDKDEAEGVPAGDDRRPGGPSPSRFPTPSLARPNQILLPATAPPPVAHSPSPPELASPPEPAGPQTPDAPQPDPAVYASDTMASAPTCLTGYEPTGATTPPSEPASPPPPRQGGNRTWQLLVGGAAALVLLGLCGLTAAALTDGGQLLNQQATPTAEPQDTRDTDPAASDLDSRDTDSAPLTAREVFPPNTLTIDGGNAGYRVLRTHSSASCAVAATGEVAEALSLLGCNQVVRATLRTPDDKHLVTAGLFNLTDRNSAERARDRIRQALDARQGRFRGMSAGDGTDVITTAPARVGWQVRGHYIAYAVVARMDGAAIRSGDTTVREILFDMLEMHLNREVLERRAAGGTATQPNPALTDDTGNQDPDTGD